MLNSLFGGFRPRTGHGSTLSPSQAGGLPQAPLSDSEAIRANLSRTRADLSRASAMVTLVDLALLWERSPAQALAQAAGATCERVDMRSMSGRRRVGQVERVALPLGGQGVVKVYCVTPGVPGPEARSIALAMAERSHMTAVLLGPDGPSQESALQSMARAVARPSWECPHLVFLVPGHGRHTPQALRGQQWPAQLRRQWQTVSPGADGLWQGLTRAWSTHASVAPPATGESPRPPARPAVAHAMPNSLHDLAADPAVRGLALVDLFNGRVKQALLGEPGALDTVAQDMCASWTLQAPLTDFDQGASAELVLLRQQGLQWLRPCGQPRGLGVLLVLQRWADLDAMRQALLHLDLNGALRPDMAPPGSRSRPPAGEVPWAALGPQR